jgi:hypothetical protein
MIATGMGLSRVLLRKVNAAAGRIGQKCRKKFTPAAPRGQRRAARVVVGYRLSLPIWMLCTTF